MALLGLGCLHVGPLILIWVMLLGLAAWRFQEKSLALAVGLYIFACWMAPVSGGGGVARTFELKPGDPLPRGFTMPESTQPATTSPSETNGN
jgi:hypothetical protein